MLEAKLGHINTTTSSHLCLARELGLYYSSSIVYTAIMASEVIKKASKLPATLGTSYSLLPKRLLSHRWIVKSAKSCLKQLGCKLKSRTFSVVLPQNNMEFGDHHHLTSK